MKRIPELREEFWKTVIVSGESADFNQDLEYAGRVADYMEFAELLCQDALTRDESCGSHFRIEHQTRDGEAKRDDERCSHVSAWEYMGEGKRSRHHKESIRYQEVTMTQRSYK